MAREIEFCVGDFDASELLVTEVLYDGGLSQCFRVTVYFHSQAEDFEATECLGQAVQLSLLPAQHSAFYIQGFIESCQPIAQVDAQGFQNYVCHIIPALSLLKQQPVCFLYRDQRVFDLIQFLLSGKCDKLSKLRLAHASPEPLMVYDYNGTPTLDSGQAVCFVLPPGKLSQDYPRYQQLLQVHQSNFDFFHQLLSLNGFSYYFDHTQAHMPLVISDCLHNSKVRQPLDLYFQAHQQVDQMGTCLYQHTIQSRASPDKTLVRGYHPEQSQGNIIAECLSALPNTNPFKSPNSYQAPIIATDPIMAERLSQYYQGHFDYTSQLASQSGQGLVYPGLLYTIEKAPLPAINAATLLMESCHWQLRVDGNTINKLNDCQWQGQSATAELSRYSLPVKFSAPSQIKNWTVRCVFSGESNLPDQDYNTLDPQGYYCLEVPKHFSSLGGYTPCLLDVRLLQPHQSGDNQQVSPLPQGTRVSVRFSDDDSQHPYISSIGHSREHASLTNTSNAQDMVWQDEKQNRFSLISSGPFAPNRRSWHQSAIELYAPNYDGYVNKAGLRIGEAVPSSQLANALPGLLWATSSQWREIHPDSYVEVFGMVQATDAKQQAISPVHRHFSQVSPTTDNPYHSIESSVPDHYQQRFLLGKTELQHQQDIANIHLTKKAAQHQIQVNQDQEIVIYQNHTQSYLPGQVLAAPSHQKSNTTTHAHQFNQLTEKHLTTQYQLSVSGSGSGNDNNHKSIYYEYYQAQHLREHLHHHNLNCALSFTFNEVQHTLITQNLGINADSMILNAPLVNQQTQGISQINASQSATTKGAIQNHLGQKHVQTHTRLSALNQLVNRKAVLSVRIQDRFAQTADATSFYGEGLQGAALKVTYTQKDLKTGKMVQHSHLLSPNAEGVFHLWSFGTQDQPLHHQGETYYITQQVTLDLQNLGQIHGGIESQQVYITHLNQQPLSFTPFKAIESQQVSLDKAKRPSNTITLTPKDWTRNPTQPLKLTPKQVVKNTTEYSVAIGVLEPAILFNFRQDAWQMALPEDQKVLYQVLAPYFGQVALVDPQDEDNGINKPTINDSDQASLDEIDKWDEGLEQPPSGQDIHEQQSSHIQQLKQQLPPLDSTSLQQLIHGPGPKSFLGITEADLIPNDHFDDWMLKSFKANGNNVTLVIHGYNVDLGTYPNAIHWQAAEKTTPLPGAESIEDGFLPPETINIIEAKTQSQKSTLALSDYEKQQAKNTQGKLLPSVQTVGSGAHKWQVQLEHNLNQGAGFDGSQYVPYTRVVQIAWQGNPNPQDYMAAPPMSQFPAQKIMGLIKQLKQQGTKVNVIAHSLGNEVLIRLLNLCGEQGIRVDHAFFWEAAIPNSSFSASKVYDAPMNMAQPINTASPSRLPSRPPANSLNIDYGYYFPKASQGMDKATILYSPLDNILGKIELSGPLYHIEHIQAYRREWEHFYAGWFDWDSHYDARQAKPEIRHTADNGPISGDMVFQSLAYNVGWLCQNTQDSLLYDLGSELLEHYIGSKDFLDESVNQELLQVAKAKIEDPSAGWVFAASSFPLAMLEPFIQQELGDDVELVSIYHLANLVVYPVSWLIESQENMEQLYQELAKSQGLFSYRQQYHPYAESLTAQVKQIESLMPKIFNNIEVFIKDLFEKLLNKITDILQIAGPLVENLGILYALYKLHQNQQAIAQVEQQAEDLFKPFVTLLLTCLMTTSKKPLGAQPNDALGHSGVDIHSDFYKKNIHTKLFQTAQLDPERKTTQWPNGVPLCVDHSAMLFPSQLMKNWVYNRYLFGELGKDGGRFEFFGKYTIK